MSLHVPQNPDGFITMQADTAHIPYGSRGSDYSGCGWIAAYNFLRAMGRPADADALSQDLSRGWLRGRLGTGPLRLRRYLQKRGFSFKTALTFGGGQRLVANAPAGILLYAHRKGLHYVAFVGRGEKKTFLNVGAGRQTAAATLMEYKRRYALSSFCYLMVPL